MLNTRVWAKGSNRKLLHTYFLICMFVMLIIYNPTFPCNLGNSNLYFPDPASSNQSVILHIVLDQGHQTSKRKVKRELQQHVVNHYTIP